MSALRGSALNYGKSHCRRKLGNEK